MGCGSSKVRAVPDGCGMGTEPKYRGVKQTQGREVTILWDTDDTGCPLDNYTSLLFLNALHKVFVQDANRKEPRVVLVYDQARPLNTSPEAVALRSYLQTQSVELLGSQGTTQQTLEDEIRRIVATAQPKSTIVLISSPSAYQDACACARQRNIFVERLLSKAGASSGVDESNADWICSLDQFLKVNSIADWRLVSADASTSVNASPLAEISCQEPRSIEPQGIEHATDAASCGIGLTTTAENTDDVTSRALEPIEQEAVTEPEAAPVVEVSPVIELDATDTADVDGKVAESEDAWQCAHVSEPAPEQIVPPKDSPPEEGSPEDGAHFEKAPSETLPFEKAPSEEAVGSVSEQQNDAAAADEPAEQPAVQQKELEVEAPQPPVESAALEDIETSVDVPQQENISLPQQPSESEAPVQPQETCDPPDQEQAADVLDGEETCDSSIGHAVDTMLDDVQTGLMQEFGSSDGSSWGGGVGEQETTKPPEGEDAPAKENGSAKGSGTVAFAEPHTNTCEDAIDAAVGALEGADSGESPTGHGDMQVHSPVKSRLGLSMRRGYVRAPSAVNERDLDMEIEPLDASAAAEDGAGEVDAPPAEAPVRDAPEVVPMTGPDPTMAWKAEIMRTLRAARDKSVKVETLLGMVPHPDCAAGGEYRAQLEEHLIERRLAVWADEGYALQLA